MKRVYAVCVFSIIMLSSVISAGAQQFSFPKAILYKLLLDGNLLGSCQIDFRADKKVGDRNERFYYLKMSKFQGIEINQDK